MAGDWREVTLGEITENFDGRRVPVKEADRRPGPYPYYGASGIVDYVDNYLFDGEYLLIAEDGENLRTRSTPVAFLARGKFWVNNHAHIVRGNGRSDTCYLMYALAAVDIGGYLTGSAMPKLTQGHMNRIELLIPERTEQRAIAHILGTLDGRIEANRRMAATLEEMGRALFRAWFVTFEPVRAKAEGRWRPGQTLPGLPASLYDTFPDRLVETEHGEIPEGWRWWLLDELAVLHRAALSPSAEPDRIFEHYSIPAYDNGQEPVQDRGETIKSNKTLVPANAILLSKLNPESNRVWLPKAKNAYPKIASTEFLCFTPKAPAGRALLYSSFCSEPFRRALEGMVTGTSKSHQRVSPDAVLRSQFCPARSEVFNRFENQVWPLLDRTNACREESRILTSLRDTLLPKLVSGAIRVKDAEAFLKARGL